MKTLKEWKLQEFAKIEVDVPFDWGKMKSWIKGTSIQIPPTLVTPLKLRVQTVAENLAQENFHKPISDLGVEEQDSIAKAVVAAVLNIIYDVKSKTTFRPQKMATMQRQLGRSRLNEPEPIEGLEEAPEEI